MPVNGTELYDFAVNKVGLGTIRAFGTTSLVYCNFNYTYTYSSGALSGQLVRVKPKDTTVMSPRTIDGIHHLPGGRTFSPWSLANERAPAGFPVWTQTIIYSGHIEPVLQEYHKLVRLVGVTSTLAFSYGEVSGGTFSPKSCQAMLLPVSGVLTRVIEKVHHPNSTWVELTASWQQVGNFTS